MKNQMVILSDYLLTLFIAIIIATISKQVHASSESIYLSSIPQITIGNSHFVDKDGIILRGMEPRGKTQELKNLGITDVIIFKNQTKNEVNDEVHNLSVLGINSYSIPFQWKNIFNQPQAQGVLTACTQILSALKIIAEVLKEREINPTSNRRLYFHCTKGEDRTGLLAGLFKLAYYKEDLNKNFEEELCKKGYEHGNPNKPYDIVQIIRNELTPLYILINDLIQQDPEFLSTLQNKQLEALEEICQQGIQNAEQKNLFAKAKQYTCQ